jgi:hypothetical protein
MRRAARPVETRLVRPTATIRVMSTSLAPLISFVPLAVLAAVAWKAVHPTPLDPSAGPVSVAEVSGAAGEDESVPPPAAPAVSDDVRAGYAELQMDSIFVKPAGPRGLEYTVEASALDGARVRLRGWMVRHLHDDPRIFLLNTQPMVLHMSEYGLADDLPPSAAHVILEDRPGWAPVWTPRPLEVCGVLELGPRQERDGRVSHVRLLADQVIDSGSGARADIVKPIGLQPARLKAAVLSKDVGADPASPSAPTFPSSTNPTK